MPVVLLLVVIVVILLGGAGLVLGALWALFVLLWAVLPWVAGIAVLMFIAALLKGSSERTFLRGKPGGQMRDRPRRKPSVRPHVVSDEARAAMAEQQRLNMEYREKISAAKKAGGE